MERPQEFNKLFFKNKKLFQCFDYNYTRMEWGKLPIHIVENFFVLERKHIEVNQVIGNINGSAYPYILGYEVRLTARKTGKVAHTDIFYLRDIMDELKDKKKYNISYPRVFYDGELVSGIEWDIKMVPEYKDVVNEAVDNFCDRIFQKLSNWTM